MPSSVNNFANTYGPEVASARNREKSNPSDISMDDFLKILAASMSNPTVMGGESGGGGNAGTDYIGQFIQFTSLQQMKEIGDGMVSSLQMTQQQQAFDMIGRQVTIADGEETVQGIVEKVKFVNGYATIVVHGTEYYLGAVQEVGDRIGRTDEADSTPTPEESADE
ncbi:flagellar basal body rod modification protein [Enterococcus sp. LJL98]